MTAANSTAALEPPYERVLIGGPRLGRLPVKSDTRALMLARFADLPVTLPRASQFWRRRAPFPPRSFGNLQWGSCTISKQAVAALRMERIETRATTQIADDEPVRVYREMSDELYGGGDNGAYETDALARWRDPAKTFRDYKGRALTIDAFARLNPFDHAEVKGALYVAGAHGLAVCLNLPLAFRSLLPPAAWDVPEGQPLTGPWVPGSWGGHSMWATDYTDVEDALGPPGFDLEHTWELPKQRLTYRAAAAYMDEVHLVIDSYDYWRVRKPQAIKYLDLAGLRTAVNRVSRVKIA